MRVPSPWSRYRCLRSKFRSRTGSPGCAPVGMDETEEHDRFLRPHLLGSVGARPFVGPSNHLSLNPPMTTMPSSSSGLELQRLRLVEDEAVDFLTRAPGKRTAVRLVELREFANKPAEVLVALSGSQPLEG